jgi:Hint domain
VIVKKNAFADNVPYQDPWVTNGHALYLDGVLIPVEFLVNHRSIIWDDRAQEVTVFHLELDLHDVFLVDGLHLDATARTRDFYVFKLPDTPGEVRVGSRAAIPQELGVARDPRSLGIALRQVVISQRTRYRATQADDPQLADGFHPFEIDTGLRGTDGEAVIPAALYVGITGPFELMVAVGCTTQYIDDGTACRAA